MPIEGNLFDPAERINSEEEASLWLKEFEQDGTPTEFVSAIGDVARAYGIVALAKQTGIPAGKLFAALNRYPPQMEDLAPILEALGVSTAKHSDAAE